jgi:ATP-binding cassette subfamily F protein uup
MSLVFSFRNVLKTYGEDTLFEELNIDFKPGEQLGLIGMNGSGKSTLLKLLARQAEPDAGTILFPASIHCVYLPQEDRFQEDKTVEQVLVEQVKQHAADEKELHKTVQKALGSGLFENPAQPVSTLSGGWKKKLAITRALCSNPDMLLLDEPTNHLDINGIIWLENLLRSAPFSYIVVSHDRTFLENVCSHTMEIGRQFPKGYFRIAGQYKKFIKERGKLLTAQEKLQSSLSSKMRREDAWLKQGAKARTTKAKFRIDQAYELKRQLGTVQVRNRNAAMVQIDFDATGRKTKKLIRVHDLSKTVNGTTLFSKVTFELGPGFCLGVAGDNGSGKSTFLSVLEKKTLPDSGRVEWAQDLKIAVYDQKRAALDPEATLKDALNPTGGDSVNYKGRSIHVVSWAKRFLFMPDQLDMPVKKLSGGEKARILIANLMRTPCDVLLLDEPTNDLDILSLEVLEDSIRQFPGAVVIVSHDRYLMDKVCHRIVYLEPGLETKIYQDFSQILSAKQKKTVKLPPKPDKPKKSKSAPKLFSYKDKYELDQMEENILAAEEKVQELSGLITEPEIIKNAVKMGEYCRELKKAQEEVQALYDRWEYLEEKKAQSEK